MATGGRKVVFSGENPSLTLYRPGTDDAIARVSYWRCVYSEAGDGNATLIWVDPEASGLGDAAPHAIYTDNPGMAKIVAGNFTRYFGGFDQHGFEQVEPTFARFFQEGDGRWYHRVVSNSGDTVVELMWGDIIEHQVRIQEEYPLGPNTWGLSTVICPCKVATIKINNQEITGEVRWSTEGEKPSSSAFLAFSETWWAHV